MTNEEAQTIVQIIQEGMPLKTRFQEESWGVTFEADGRFRYYSSRMIEFEDENGRLQTKWETNERFYTEEGLVRFFEKLYRFDVIMRWLEPRG